MSCNASQSLSIVVPVYNEEDNIHPLVDRVHHAMQTYAHPWELIIVDDGKGIPESFDLEKAGSLGMKLVHVLTSQLGGTINLDSSNGTRYQIIFPEKSS